MAATTNSWQQNRSIGVRPCANKVFLHDPQMEDSSDGRLACPALMAADWRSNNTATAGPSAEDGKGRPNSTEEDNISGGMLDNNSDTAGTDAGKLVCRQEALSGIKVHACEYAGCGARFSRPSRLEVHYRTHTGEVSTPAWKYELTRLYFYVFYAWGLQLQWT